MYALAPRATLSPVRKKLRALGELPRGWHFGQGVPVAEHSITAADRFLSLAEQLAIRTDVFPGIESECMVAFYQGDYCVRVVIDPDHHHALYGLRVERGKGQNVETVKEDDAASLGDV